MGQFSPPHHQYQELLATTRTEVEHLRLELAGTREQSQLLVAARDHCLQELSSTKAEGAHAAGWGAPLLHAVGARLPASAEKSRREELDAQLEAARAGLEDMRMELERCAPQRHPRPSARAGSSLSCLESQSYGREGGAASRAVEGAEGPARGHESARPTPRHRQIKCWRPSTWSMGRRWRRSREGSEID